MGISSWFNNIFREAADQQASFRLLARPLSSAYGKIVQMREKAYKHGLLSSKRLPGLCISVGNITLGGTGKSPVVIALAQHLCADGYSPAILTRGYGSTLKKGECALLLDGAYQAATRHRPNFADEALMQSHALPGVPIIVGSNRYRAAQWYLGLPNAKQPSHWILDDGYQHLALYRDLNILLLDAQRPFGNKQLLPLGNLREPAGALERAHVLMLTRAREAAKSQEDAGQHLFRNLPLFAVPFHTTAPHQVASSREFGNLANLSESPLLAVAGIAKPEDFLRSLASHGIKPARQLLVGDHQVISPAQLLAQSIDLAGIITTAKDYFRDPASFAHCKKPVFILALHADIPYTSLKTTFPRLFP